MPVGVPWLVVGNLVVGNLVEVASESWRKISEWGTQQSASLSPGDTGTEMSSVQSSTSYSSTSESTASTERAASERAAAEKAAAENAAEKKASEKAAAEKEAAKRTAAEKAAAEKAAAEKAAAEKAAAEKPAALQPFEVEATFNSDAPREEQILAIMREFGYAEFSREEACLALEQYGHDRSGHDLPVHEIVTRIVGTSDRAWFS